MAIRGSLILLAVVAATEAAGAQTACPVNPKLAAGPGTIVGTVTDNQGDVIDNVDVYLGTPRRRVLSTDGRFRFDSLPAGEYEVSSRRLGYQPQVRTVSVTPTGGVVAFCLVPVPRGLPPVISNRAAGGLAGIITDSASRPLADADIVVSGPNGTKKTVSDDAGEFYVDVRSGPYLVQVKRPWFTTGNLSITIPKDSGRYMRIPLSAEHNSSKAARRVENVTAFEWHWAMIRAIGLKYYTRDDLDKTSMNEVLQVARSWVGVMDESCPALIMNDGQPYSLPLWSLKTEDVEMLAVIRGGMRQAKGRSMSVRGGVCTGTVHVWLKK